MRAPEFFIALFQRFAPVEKTELANLRTELLTYFNTAMDRTRFKKNRNMEDLERQAQEIEGRMEKLDKNSPNYQADYEQAFFQLEQLENQMEPPTIFEKIVEFLEKPWVRALLMVLFVVGSRWLMKRMTQPDKPEEEEMEDLPQNQGYNQGWYPPQQPPFNPYGYPSNYPPYPPDPRSQPRR